MEECQFSDMFKIFVVQVLIWILEELCLMNLICVLEKLILIALVYLLCFSTMEADPHRWEA